MFKQEKMNYWGDTYVVFDRNDKKMIREVILESFQKMKFPRTMEAKLTRIKWANAYLKNDNELNIGVCIEFKFPINMENSKYRSCWTSQVIHLQIPFSDFREYKLNKLL